MSVYFFYVFCSPRMRAKVFYMEATAFAFPLNFVEGQRIVGVRLVVVVVETTVVQVPRVRRISLTTRPPCAYLAVIILFLTTLLCAVYSKQPPS